MSHTDTVKQFAEMLYRAVPRADIAIRDWEGNRYGPDQSSATLVLNHPGSLRAALIAPTDLSAGEAYIYEDIDFEGDILAALYLGNNLDQLRKQPRMLAKALNLVRSLPNESNRRLHRRPRLSGRLHSMARDRQAISSHYDTGNEFFSLFLDPSKTYSCAYFLDPLESLEIAQRRKLDLVSRKLLLRPGLSLLDVGSGWGSMLLHAGKNCDVVGHGITLSHEQFEESNRRFADVGLGHQLAVEMKDYREVSGSFDAISSIGMFEHVGAGQLTTYFEKMFGLLKPGGLMLNHGITTRERRRLPRLRETFVSTHVFPDGELLPIENVIQAAEDAGFEVRDVESLRMHYALTLRNWIANLESNRERAIKLTSEKTYRTWRIYMAGSVVGFETAGISVYQMILAKPNTPWQFGRRWAVAADDTAEAGS
ncbi:MAG: cyclopropane-fatty-acyl-phospholipid synthase family protein [Acidimicrobiia bacterium]|nr:cyclopropane-fatty-acyl-phospholipid synthase family protein [Acidimicrobiia bacterium]NNL27610.1 class I SAM-dependent methyltransferase [Acidimicrobiia bacterium]